MIVLEKCEICGKKLTAEEKVKFGHECQKCQDHLKDLLDRALERDKAKQQKPQKPVIPWVKGPPDLNEYEVGDDFLIKDDFHKCILTVDTRNGKKVLEDAETSYVWELSGIEWHVKMNDPDSEG